MNSESQVLENALALVLWIENAEWKKNIVLVHCI